MEPCPAYQLQALSLAVVEWEVFRKYLLLMGRTRDCSPASINRGDTCTERKCGVSSG